jgi:hypothetical protein
MKENKPPQVAQVTPLLLMAIHPQWWPQKADKESLFESGQAKRQVMQL